MVDELQIENGNYTRIVNRVIEELVKVPLLGAEMAVCLFIIRKTYGYHKKEDEISLTQFEAALNRSRPTIVKALKNLQLVNILKLVKKGSSKNQSNLWAFNKYYSTWKVVKPPQLVKNRTSTSKEKLKQLVKTPKHTKDNNKRKTKEIAPVGAEVPQSKHNPLGGELIKAFIVFNPACAKYYGNTTQRGACDRLIEAYGLEKVLKVIAILPKTNTMQYVPSVSTPLQLEEKWTSLESAMLKKKAEYGEKLTKYKVAFH